MNPRLIEIFIEASIIDGLSGREGKVATYILKFLKNLGLNPYTDYSFTNTESETGNVLCEINGGGDFLISSHMDTARSTKGVKHIFQEDRIVSDNLTVLGVDNRVGITILLALAEKFVRESLKVKPFTLAFITCEETSLYGSKYLEIKENIQRAFVFDSQYSPGKYINRSYGAIGFKVEIFGKASHSGISPENGINAIEILRNASNSLKFGRNEPELTFNIGKIKGGQATNVVPDYVVLEGEFRSTDMKKVEERVVMLKTKFQNCAEELGGKINFNWDWDFKPFFVSPESVTGKMISSAIEKVGLIPEAVLSAGGSDANSFNGRGIEAVNIGIGAQNPHANNEFILFKDFDDAFNIAIELIKESK
jgi:tripeptide aminopeptidase